MALLKPQWQALTPATRLEAGRQHLKDLWSS